MGTELLRASDVMPPAESRRARKARLRAERDGLTALHPMRAVINERPEEARAADLALWVDAIRAELL